MTEPTIFIRDAAASDFNDVMTVEKEAFGYDKEAILVAELLEDTTAQPVVSLLAFAGDEPVGHILFTKASLEGPGPAPLIYLLAPLAVRPAFQNKGIGGMLIREGLKRLKDMGVRLVFVLGHEAYYPKYGFVGGAERMGFAAPYPIPEIHAGAWMVQNLGSDDYAGISGRVVCADALQKPEHWRE